MKRLLVFFIFLVLSLPAIARNRQVVVTVTNPLDMNRTNEIVSIGWKKIAEKMKGINISKITVRDTTSGDILPHQLIDENSDGTPDELIFLANFQANEKRTFFIENRKASQNIEPLTYVGFMVPREDIAWENDRIAFRIYGPAMAKDVNNGIDVWTKRVRYLIIEKWYKGDQAPGDQRISYHEDHGEGADFFSVGRSLGAGSCALYKSDSLYQPGVFEKYKIIAKGPIRLIFEVTYTPFEYNGKKITETKRITLDAGSNLNKIEVQYNSIGSNDGVMFAAGLVKRPNVSIFTDKEKGLASLWGPINDNPVNEYLGTGIVMINEKIDTIKENNGHLLVVGKSKLSKKITYYTGAGWTRTGDFENIQDWNNYLSDFAIKLRNELIIRTF